MNDGGWPTLREPWERLKWARQRWQRLNGMPDNMSAAAAALGMKEGTYRAYERRPESSKATELDYETAVHFARKFGVNWVWLLSGECSPFESQYQSRIMQAAAAVLADRSEEERAVLAEKLEQLIRLVGRRD